MTAQPRTSVRDRSLPAVLLGVLAVLASLLTAPGTPVAGASSASTAAVAAVRGAAPGTMLRDARDPRALQRRGARERAGSAAPVERFVGTGQGPGPVSAVLLAALLTVLVAGGLAGRGRPGHVARRTARVRRDRAPPVLALA